MLAVVGGLLSVWLGELTHINYAILGLVLGVIFTQLGVVPKNLLQKAQASGFINMVVFAAIIPALANISISDLIDLILPLDGCVRGVGTFHLCYDESPAGVEDSGG